MTQFACDAEWLETDGLGGFASGTVSGIRTRRYHALLLAARTPPTERFVLVSGLEVWAESGEVETALTSHRYQGDVVHPNGFHHIEQFAPEPWPTWTYRLADGTRVRHEVFVPRGHAASVCSWKVLTEGARVRLRVRPLIAVRDYHHLHAENGSFSFLAEASDGQVTWRPYHGTPPIRARFSGTYRNDPDWYRSFLYSRERDRGLDSTEDCATPGEFVFELGDESPEGAIVLSTDTPPNRPLPEGDALTALGVLREQEEARREDLGTGLARAADAYIVERGVASTIIAGYPWFTDWGRDTFIAIRGLCLATGRLEIARQILVEWSRAQVGGLLPNRFPDAGEAPEFHSVDAALWYVQAAHEFLAMAESSNEIELSDGDASIIRRTCVRVCEAYASGTSLGIRMDSDALLACGEGDSSLTWMDARVGGKAITPRVGKPVEIQALWINALRLASADQPPLATLADRAQSVFDDRFWNEERGCLFDILDVNHEPGTRDDGVRPNQLFAIGGLSHQIAQGARARSIVDLCERELWTPMGMRTLDPGDPGFIGVYEGGPWDRDSAYHNGTAWPWVSGAFVEAWVRVRGGTEDAKREARERFLAPLVQSVTTHGIGHIAEIADGDAPHMPRGCPFQAWSVGEALRLDRLVL